MPGEIYKSHEVGARREISKSVGEDLAKMNCADSFVCVHGVCFVLALDSLRELCKNGTNAISYLAGQLGWGGGYIIPQSIFLTSGPRHLKPVKYSTTQYGTALPASNIKDS